MSNSNLKVYKGNDLTKYRLDEINKIKHYLNTEIKERKDIIRKISKYIFALIMQTNFLLHYHHRLVL